MPTGTLILHAESSHPDGVVLYTRVCASADPKDGEFAWVLQVGSQERLLGIVQTVKEFGSGINGHRRRLGLRGSLIQSSASSWSSSATG
ncbi:hypothetical protein MPNT_30155 [Candidatus Methylacidithermus pantelleriae]|uniref:Uncharacterized protein n=1 Tax=Candidatus Methylacidithermus pantelleriae TaxID=2744239 RepID=A0A8J2BK92_9BACT|nr:hypothetical protein MPNT_30155 [Candidatus Methylacidithermus pantelleriae]